VKHRGGRSDLVINLLPCESTVVVIPVLNDNRMRAASCYFSINGSCKIYAFRILNVLVICAMLIPSTNFGYNGIIQLWRIARVRGSII